MSKPFALTPTLPLPTSAKAMPSITLENQEKLSKLTKRLINLAIQVKSNVLYLPYLTQPIFPTHSESIRRKVLSPSRPVTHGTKRQKSYRQSFN
jgi:hypothetical protein